MKRSNNSKWKFRIVALLLLNGIVARFNVTSLLIIDPIDGVIDCSLGSVHRWFFLSKRLKISQFTLLAKNAKIPYIRYISWYLYMYLLPRCYIIYQYSNTLGISKLDFSFLFFARLKFTLQFKNNKVYHLILETIYFHHGI